MTKDTNYKCSDYTTFSSLLLLIQIYSQSFLSTFSSLLYFSYY